MANIRKQVQEKGKVARVPFGTTRLRMQLSDDDMAGFKERGMKTHWFNDRDGRIPRAKAAGYSFVHPDHATSLGQGAIHGGNTDEGSRVSMIVSKGDGPEVIAFLMQLPIELWTKDQKAKMDRIDEREKTDPFGEGDKEYGSGVTYAH